MKNIIESKFTDADYAAVSAALGDLETRLSGKTESLDTDERRRYGSINEQNKLIVNKANEYRQTQPEKGSPNVDWDKFESDYKARTHIESWINRLTAIIHDLESTKIMHDYDNYQDALQDYKFAQFQADSGAEGYAAKVTEFKQFFAKSPPEPTPEGDGGGSNP